MPNETTLGFIAAGGRARAHMTYAYEIREKDYLFCDRADNYPHNAFVEHASSVPEWTEDVSDIHPEITAIFDPSETARERAAQLCHEHGDSPSLYDSLEAFLAADEYDAIVVASPNDTHVEHLPPVLERGIDVLCEKPLATTLSDHDRLIDAADDSRSLFYAGFNLRSSMLFRKLKALIDRDHVGELGMISCHETRCPFPSGYRYSHERSGGALLEKNCHDFDLFNWFAEADPVKVSAFGGQHVLSVDSEIDDHATVIIEYDNGVKGTLELCLYSPVYRDRQYAVRGSEGIIRTAEKPNTLSLFTRNGHDQYTVGQSHQHEADAEYVGHGGADLVEMKRFLRCVQGREEPPATLREAKKAAAVALGAERAIRTDAVVEIDSAYDLVE